MGDSCANKYMLLRCPSLEEHRNVYSNIRNLLRNQVGIPLDRVLIYHGMACSKTIPELWTVSRKRLELRIMNTNRVTLVQIEVKSCKKSAIVKLTLELVQTAPLAKEPQHNHL